LVAKLTYDRRNSLERDVVAEWQEFARDRALLFQVRVTVVKARK
jgi:hypothetical protein